MAHGIRSRQIVWSVSLLGSTLAIGLALRPAAGDDLPGCPSGNCPNCPVNSKYFGYYPTIWRRWPGTEPQPQPVAPPASEGIGVPPVETPPATEEIENKTKPATPDSSGAGPATTNPTPDAANKPSAPPPDEDPNAKKPNVPPGNGAAPVAPEAPQKLNQMPPNRGNNAEPAYFGSNRQPLHPMGPRPEAWPPTNVLRSEEIRASFQFPDGVTLTKATAIPTAAPSTSTTGLPSPIRFDAGQPKPSAIAWPARQTDNVPSPLWPQPNFGRPRDVPVPAAQLTPPVNWNASQTRPADSWHPDLGPSAAEKSSFADDVHFSNPAPATTSNATPPALHWMDPAQPKSLCRDSSLNGRSLSATADPFNDSQCSSTQTKATRPAEIAFKPSADNLNGVSRRIPFIPSASLSNPMAPLDPRELTDQSAPARFAPAEASTSRLAPPNKVSDISVPMISTATVQPQRLAASKASQNNVSQIDPLAIRKSLEAARPADRRELSPFVAGAPMVAEQKRAVPRSAGGLPIDSQSAPHNSSPKDQFQFADGIAPDRKGLDGFNAGAATIGKGDLQFAATAMPERLMSVDPPKVNRPPLAGAAQMNPRTPQPLVKPQGASVIVSDDGGMSGGVQPAAYVAPVSSSPLTAGRDNPLRMATLPSREVLSTDTTQIAWPEPQAGPARSAPGWTNPLR
jgi:hypothetical protein